VIYRSIGALKSDKKVVSNNTYVSLVYEDSVSASDREDMHQRDAKIRLSEP